MVNAVVMAGSKNSGLLAEFSEEKNEAMIKIADKPMVQYVVEALLSSKFVARIFIFGPASLRSIFPDDCVEVVESLGTALENMLAGVERAGNASRVLIVTSDVPLLTAEAVDNLVELCNDAQVDFYYPIVPMDIIEQKFPGVNRTAVKLKEGSFTGGNLFIVNPVKVPGTAGKVAEFVKYRKSPFNLCRILGIKFVAKFLTNRLSITGLEEKLSEILGVNAKAMITRYPEIGLDVDKPSDFAVVLRCLEKSA